MKGVGVYQILMPYMEVDDEIVKGKERHGFLLIHGVEWLIIGI